jgi:cullin 3
MSVIVCGGNFWPFSIKDVSCTFPPILTQGMTSFKKYYDEVHSGRLLTVHSELGSVDVKIRFKARSHEVNLSTHAMVVLALFERGEDSLSYEVRFFRSLPHSSS